MTNPSPYYMNFDLYYVLITFDYEIAVNLAVDPNGISIPYVLSWYNNQTDSFEQWSLVVASSQPLNFSSIDALPYITNSVVAPSTILSIDVINNDGSYNGTQCITTFFDDYNQEYYTFNTTDPDCALDSYELLRGPCSNDTQCDGETTCQSSWLPWSDSSPNWGIFIPSVKQCLPSPNDEYLIAPIVINALEFYIEPDSSGLFPTQEDALANITEQIESFLSILEGHPDLCAVDSMYYNVDITNRVTYSNVSLYIFNISNDCTLFLVNNAEYPEAITDDPGDVLTLSDDLASRLATSLLHPVSFLTMAPECLFQATFGVEQQPLLGDANMNQTVSMCGITLIDGSSCPIPCQNTDNNTSSPSSNDTYVNLVRYNITIVDQDSDYSNAMALAATVVQIQTYLQDNCFYDDSVWEYYIPSSSPAIYIVGYATDVDLNDTQRCTSAMDLSEYSVASIVVTEVTPDFDVSTCVAAVNSTIASVTDDVFTVVNQTKAFVCDRSLCGDVEDVACYDWAFESCSTNADCSSSMECAVSGELEETIGHSVCLSKPSSAFGGPAGSVFGLVVALITMLYVTYGLY